MSIEIENPETVYEKIDAIANLVGQMNLAKMVNDNEQFKWAHEKASQLLFDAARQMEELGIEDK